MHLPSSSLVPLGQSHLHVTELNTRPGGHFILGQTQEQEFRSNILGLMQDLGIQQAHSPPPLPFAKVGRQKQNDLVFWLSGHGLRVTHLSLTVMSEQRGQRHLLALVSYTQVGLPFCSRHLNAEKNMFSSTHRKK